MCCSAGVLGVHTTQLIQGLACSCCVNAAPQPTAGVLLRVLVWHYCSVVVLVITFVARSSAPTVLRPLLQATTGVAPREVIAASRGVARLASAGFLPFPTATSALLDCAAAHSPQDSVFQACVRLLAKLVATLTAHTHSAAVVERLVELAAGSVAAAAQVMFAVSNHPAVVRQQLPAWASLAVQHLRVPALALAPGAGLEHAGGLVAATAAARLAAAMWRDHAPHAPHAPCLDKVAAVLCEAISHAAAVAPSGCTCFDGCSHDPSSVWRRPRPACTWHSLMHALLRAAAHCPRTVPSSVDPVLDAVLGFTARRCLQLSPRARHEAARRLLSQHGSTARAPHLSAQRVVLGWEAVSGARALAGVAAAHPAASLSRVGGSVVALLRLLLPVCAPSRVLTRPAKRPRVMGHTSAGGSGRLVDGCGSPAAVLVSVLATVLFRCHQPLQGGQTGTVSSSLAAACAGFEAEMEKLFGFDTRGSDGAASCDPWMACVAVLALWFLGDGSHALCGVWWVLHAGFWWDGKQCAVAGTPLLRKPCVLAGRILMWGDCPASKQRCRCVAACVWLCGCVCVCSHLPIAHNHHNTPPCLDSRVHTRY